MAAPSEGAQPAGAGRGPDILQLLGRFYLGYGISWLGAFVGLAWGFVDGFIGGWLLGWLYNKFAG